jgi:hypothetical protein
VDFPEPAMPMARMQTGFLEEDMIEREREDA